MSAFVGVCALIAMLALAIRLAGRQHRLLHLFQLEHYEPSRLMLWLRRREELFIGNELMGAGALLLAATALVAVGGGLGWVGGALLLLAVAGVPLGRSDWRREAVKPLVFTARAKRLLALSLLAPALLVLASVGLALAGMSALGLGILLGLGWVALLLAPQSLLVANAALKPVQGAVNRRFLQSAQRALRDYQPLVVGITGSYGKTTTKFCVGEVLGVQRPTLVTPESYNSYLGVLRTINERLAPEHQAFVVEMGMFRKGDIAELCELVKPSVGVITAIGPMHLERLGSIEAIASAKAELAEALPEDGQLITNGDDPLCVAIADDTRAHARAHVALFSIDNQAAPVRATNVSLADGHTKFDLHLGAGSPPTPVSAQLLGTHNVYNLLAAAAVGWTLEMEPAQIVLGLERVKAPEHRLQPIHNRRAGIVVIDDAYNSNPEGAASALEVLRDHDAKRRLLVTPGMVELGELEEELNRRFGEQAGVVCDVVILVGRDRTRPIYEGLMSVGMEGSGVKVVRDIAEATTLLGTLTRAGDVVLFENDLPDTYAEQPRPEAGAGRVGAAAWG